MLTPSKREDVPTTYFTSILQSFLLKPAYKSDQKHKEPVNNGSFQSPFVSMAQGIHFKRFRTNAVSRNLGR